MSSDTFHLIRSYDNYDKKNNNNKIPIRRDTGTQMQGKNYGDADSYQIWQVARAATAAPFYFSELKLILDNHHGPRTIYFSDGGFGHTNNPTLVGIEEIEELHGKPNVGVIVSVGTARADDDSTRRGFLHRVKGGFNRATDPKIVAKQVARENLPFYFRINDEAGINVELDEWKPNGFFTKHPGRDTLETIENRFFRWIARMENSKRLEECARELARRRRKRAEDGSRWERYAIGAQYRCVHHTCNRRFGYREDFDEHWERVHASDDLNGDARQPAVDIWKYQRGAGAQ